jgi:surface carbohydrate biosynthesis protein (TIGR04326 family)
LKGFTLPPFCEFSTESADTLINCSDVIFAANSSTLSVEAAWYGMPTIISADPRGINHSPLLPLEIVDFVSDAATLCEQLNNPPRIAIPDDFLLLDPALPRWRSMMQSFS